MRQPGVSHHALRSCSQWRATAAPALKTAAALISWDYRCRRVSGVRASRDQVGHKSNRHALRGGRRWSILRRPGSSRMSLLSASPMLLCCLPLSSLWATVPRPMGWAYSVSSYSCVNMRPVIHFPLAFYYFTIWLCFDSHSNTGQSASLFSSIWDGCFCF